jgi:hypothetical protein
MMLLNDLYFKWDDRENFKAETNTDHNLGAQSAVKPVVGVETKAKGKSTVFGLEDTEINP